MITSSKDNNSQLLETPAQVSVVISTRNRGGEILAAIKSILLNDYPDFELRVVDQSDNDQTKLAVEPFLEDERFIYMRSNTVGVSTGRNLAILSSNNELICITDDDCEVPPDWISKIVKAFNVNQGIGVIFGNVEEGKHDLTGGFIPSYKRNYPFLALSIKEKNKVRGIGACMAIRKSAWEVVNGFDEMLGPGSKLRCAEENDFEIKAMLSGYYVYETPEIALLHNGFRTWQEGKELAKRNYFGLGAMLGKYIKFRRFFIVPILYFEVKTIIVQQLIQNSIANRKISGVTPLIYLFKGLWKGIFTPVDLKTGNFIEKNGSLTTYYIKS